MSNRQKSVALQQDDPYRVPPRKPKRKFEPGNLTIPLIFLGILLGMFALKCGQ